MLVDAATEVEEAMAAGVACRFVPTRKPGLNQLFQEQPLHVRQTRNVATALF